MSFREKSAWACLVATAAVLIPYFVHVFGGLARGEAGAGSVLAAFVAAVALQTALLVAAHIAIAARSGPERKDERDTTIERKSFRNAYYVLACSLFAAVIAVFVVAVATPAIAWRSLTFVGQLVLLCFVVAELSRYLTQVVLYRRGG